MSTELFERLATSDDRTLLKAFMGSPPPPWEMLAGFQWRGYNTDPNLRWLGLRKFIKAFFVGADGDEGCNVKVEQNDFAEPWQPRLRDGSIQPFAFYLVREQDDRTRLKRNPRALLLDYGASPRNRPYDLARTIRDYVVQPAPDDPDVMLGRAYLGVGGLRAASSFFVIERWATFPEDVIQPR